MPNWKKVVTSGSKAVLQTLEVNPQPSSATTTHGANLQIMSSGSGTQYGLLISGSTFNGIPLALIQTSGSGTTGQGEFIYGKGKNGEDSFRIRQGAGGAGTFALFCSESTDRQFITHQFSDPTQGAVSYVNYSEDSRSNAYFGIGVNNPSSHLHVSGNAILTGDIQIGTGTVAISGSAGTISASGAISASDLFLGGGSDSFIDVDGHITASGAVSASGTGLFGALKINGTDYLGNPTTLSELDESTDATDDKIILWDQNASAWKYMTLDNLQDSIDTTGGGGGSVSGDTFATDLRIGRDSDNHIDFTTDNQIDFDVDGETAFIIKNTSDSGSIAVSGSVKIQPQTTVPALSESRLYNVTSENGAVVDDLHFGTDGLTPAFAFVTLDDDSTDTGSEIAFGVGSAVTTTSHNMRVTHDSSTDGVLIHPQLSGTYKVTANLFTDDSSGGTAVYDINVGGSTVYTATAKTHQSVDPVNRTLIYIGEITSGSSIQVTADGSSFHYDLGSSFMAERLS